MKKSIKKFFSGSLKGFVLTVGLGLSTNIAFAADNPRDFINRNNYLPGGKYRLFGNSRGAVTDLRGNVLSQGTIAFNTGPIQTTVTSFSGKIEYNQEFHNHGWRVHSPFSSSASRSFDSKKGSPATGGQTVTNFNIQASKVHPADGYDGEQGGGYPTPTGARDEYTYVVNGTVRTIRVVNPDKPQPPKSDNKPNNPYNNNGSDSGNNGQPENNSGDTDRNHDLAGSDNPNMPNGSPDGGNDALADNGELKPQQDTYYGDTCIDCGVDPNKYGYGGDFQQTAGPAAPFVVAAGVLLKKGIQKGAQQFGKKAAEKAAQEKAKQQAKKEALEESQKQIDKLSKKQRPGQPFTPAGKKAVINDNQLKNGGVTTCTNCGVKTVPAKQSQKGVTPPKNETNVDHKIAKAKGGSGTPDNGQVLCRGCNLKKGAK